MYEEHPKWDPDDKLDEYKWRALVKQYFIPDEEEEETSFKVALTDDNGVWGLVEFSKDGSDWTSGVVESDDGFEYYPRHYMSYLKPADIIQWLHRDFSSVARVKDE